MKFQKMMLAGCFLGLMMMGVFPVSDALAQQSLPELIIDSSSLVIDDSDPGDKHTGDGLILIPRDSAGQLMTGLSSENIVLPDGFEAVSLEKVTVPWDVFFVTDASNSMRGQPFEDAKTSMVELLSELPSDTSVSILVFSDQSHYGDPFEQLEPTDSVEEAVSFIEQQSAILDGGTCVWDALNEALVSDSRLENPAIILLTDGVDELGGTATGPCSVTTRSEVIAKAQSSSTPIHVVGIQSERFSADSLRPVAENTNGSFVVADSSAELASVLKRVHAQNGEQYQLTIRSDAPPVPQNVRVGVRQNDVFIENSFSYLPPTLEPILDLELVTIENSDEDRYELVLHTVSQTPIESVTLISEGSGPSDKVNVNDFPITLVATERDDALVYTSKDLSVSFNPDDSLIVKAIYGNELEASSNSIELPTIEPVASEVILEGNNFPYWLFGLVLLGGLGYLVYAKFYAEAEPEVDYASIGSWFDQDLGLESQSVRFSAGGLEPSIKPLDQVTQEYESESVTQEYEEAVGYLTVLTSPDFQKGTRFPIYPRNMLIGRSRYQCDIEVPDVSVSRRHLLLRYGSGGFSAEDQQSKHGTFVNDIKLDENEVPLSDGDLIRFGQKTCFSLELSHVSQEVEDIVFNRV